MDYVYKVLTRPDSTPVMESVSASGTAPNGPAKTAKYQMLPHARPGGVAGLVEILADNNGHQDIFRLADTLAFEIDDLLPTVEAAAMLGFLTVSEGDVEITADGRLFVDADILHRKELFRKAALEHAALIRQITRSLDAKANHRLTGRILPRPSRRAFHRKRNPAAN